MSCDSTQNLPSNNKLDVSSGLSDGNSNLPLQLHSDFHDQSSEGIRLAQAKAASSGTEDDKSPSQANPAPKSRSPSPRVRDRHNSGQYSRSPSPISRDDDSYHQGRSPSPNVRDREGTQRRSGTAIPSSGDRVKKAEDPIDVNETRQTALLKEQRTESARDGITSTLTSILNANATQDMAQPSAELSGTGEGAESQTASPELPETQESFDGNSHLRLLKEPVADANIDVAPLEAEAQQYVKGLLMDISKDEPVLDLNSVSEYIKRLKQIEESVQQKEAALKETESTNERLMKQVARMEDECQHLKQLIEEKDAQLDLEREKRKAAEHCVSELEGQSKLVRSSDDALLERETNVVEKEKKLIDMHSQLMAKEQAVESKYVEVDQARKIMQEQYNERESKFEERLREFERSERKARAAVDEKEKNLMVREERLRRAEQNLEEANNHLATRLNEVFEKEKALEAKDATVLGKANLSEAKEQVMRSRENVLEVHEKLANEREKLMNNREKDIASRDAKLTVKEEAVDAAERVIQEKEAQIMEREKQLQSQTVTIDQRENALMSAEADMVARRAVLEDREEQFNKREKEIAAQEAELQYVDEELKGREDDMRKQVQVCAERMAVVDEHEKSWNDRELALRRKEMDMQAREKLLDPIKTMLEGREARIHELGQALQRRQLQLDEREMRIVELEGILGEREVAWTAEEQQIERKARQFIQKENEVNELCKALREQESSLEQRERLYAQREATILPREAQLEPREQELINREKKMAVREERMDRMIAEVDRREKEIDKRRRELTVILDRERELERSRVMWSEKRAGADYLGKSMLEQVKKPGKLKSPYGSTLNKSGLAAVQPSHYAVQLQKRKQTLIDVEQRVAALAKAFDTIIHPAGTGDLSNETFDAVQQEEIQKILQREREFKGEVALLRKLKASCPLGQRTKWSIGTGTENSKIETIERWWKETVTELIDKRLLEILTERKAYFQAALRTLNVEVEVSEEGMLTGASTSALAITSGPRDIRKLANHKPTQAFTKTFDPVAANAATPIFSTLSSTTNMPGQASPIHRPMSASAALITQSWPA